MNNSVTKTVPQIFKDNICTVFNLLNLLIAISLAAVGIIQEIKAKRQGNRNTAR